MALDEITTPTAKEALRSKAKTLDKHEQLCELSKALAVLASASVRIALFTSLPSLLHYLYLQSNILFLLFLSVCEQGT